MRCWLALFLLMGPLCAASADEQPGTPAEKPCNQHPQLAGACYVVRGRMGFYNGTPSVRIWRVGTKRILGVSEGRYRMEGYANIPQAVVRQLSWDHWLFGDFTVCPFQPERPEAMRLVCVQGVTNTSVRPR